MGKRLRQKTETNRSVIKSVEVGDKNKAKVEVKINIKEHDMINDNHKNYNFIYSSIEKRLISEVEAVMNIKKTMKIQLVLNVIIFRSVSVDGDGNPPKPRWEDSWIVYDAEKGYYEYKPLITSTKIQQVGINNLKDVLDTSKSRMENLFTVEVNNLGSDWRLDRIKYFMIACYEIKPSRASSYIPTPAPYNNPKCGLINIQNTDNKCFSYCMKYHQTEKLKNDHNITILNKIDDKYNYDDIEYPVNFDDIKQFEKNNEVCINVYGISDEKTIILEYMGDIHYIKNDIIYLLRISDDGNSHSVYIKQISRLLK